MTPTPRDKLDLTNVTIWAATNIPQDQFSTQNNYSKELVVNPPPNVSFREQQSIDKCIQHLKTRFLLLFDSTKVSGSATRATGVKHDVILNTSSNLKSAPGRYSPQDTRILKESVDAGIKDGVLYSGQSPFSSRAILVPKDGKPKGRMVIDFRQINSHTEKSAYPLPVVQDEIRKASGHNFYIKLDLKSGFYQIELTEQAQKICSFVTPQGQYLFRVMPFGRTNAPATFQRAMDECLQPVRNITSNMIDDVITWGNTVEETTRNASLVMERLDSCGYKLNPRKCAWFVTQTKFLGHIIDRHGIQVDPSKIQTILDRPIPRTVTEVRAFLNSCNYFRDYIKLFSTLAGPLYSLTSIEGKNVPVSLNDEQIASWKATRNALITIPILKPMDPQLPVVLDVDASEKYTGGVLLQPNEQLTPILRIKLSQPTMEGAHLNPVAYTSHKLNPTQQRYSFQEREALGIVQALQT